MRFYIVCNFISHLFCSNLLLNCIMLGLYYYAAYGTACSSYERGVNSRWQHRIMTRGQGKRNPEEINKRKTIIAYKSFLTANGVMNICGLFTSNYKIKILTPIPKLKLILTLTKECKKICDWLVSSCLLIGRCPLSLAPFG